MNWIAGILLICAAVLKAIGLIADPTATLVRPVDAFLLPMQIGLEFAFGILVATGVRWRTLRWWTMLLFSGFAAYTLYLAIDGAASCGCFGPVHINPWWTFLLDLTVVLGLALSTIRGQQALTYSNGQCDAVKAQPSGYRKNLIAGSMAVLVIVVALAARALYRHTAVAYGASTMSNGLVVLEPEKWIGRKLPVADSIDADLSRDDWIAVLHRHGCPSCEEALPKYEQLARTGRRVALVEVPPYGDSALVDSACLCCRLNDDHEWFVQTPVEIQLHNGIVAAVNAPSH